MRAVRGGLRAVLAVLTVVGAVAVSGPQSAGAALAPADTPGEPAAGSILVNVRDASSGDGVAAACVDVHVDVDGPVVGTACAPAGSSQVVVPPEDLAGNSWVFLFVRAGEPYADAWYGQEDGVAYAAAAASGQTVTVALPEAAFLTGTLTLPDGSPVPDGEVSIGADEQPLYSTSILQGRWRVKVFPGEWKVRFDVAGRRQYAVGVADDSFLARTYDVAAGAEVTVDDVLLDDSTVGTVTFTGQVRDAVTGRGVAGACLLPYRGPNWPDEAPSWDGTGCPYFAGATRADADGRYSVTSPWSPDNGVVITAIDPAGLHARASRSWFGSALPRPGTVTSDVNFSLTTTGAIKGRVLDPAGKPVAGVCPWAGPEPWATHTYLQACTRADGWWMVGELAAQRTRVRLSAPVGENGQSSGFVDVYVPGSASSPKGAKLTVKPGRQVNAPVSTLQREGVLIGRVHDAAGHPVAGVDVALRAPGVTGRYLGSVTTTDEQGRYRLGGLSAQDSVVEVSDPVGEWASTWSGSRTDPALATKVPVRYGTTTTQDFTVGPAGALTVNVRGASLPAEAGTLEVAAYSVSGAWLGVSESLTSQDARAAQGASVVLKGLPPVPTLVRTTLTYDGRTRSWWYRTPGSGQPRSSVPVTAGATSGVGLSVKW
ncbi:MAG: carboxypeptidase-like regulatory domain-containing protein [Kineosporiaceae bacterium]